MIKSAGSIAKLGAVGHSLGASVGQGDVTAASGLLHPRGACIMSMGLCISSIYLVLTIVMF